MRQSMVVVIRALLAGLPLTLALAMCRPAPSPMTEPIEITSAPPAPALALPPAPTPERDPAPDPAPESGALTRISFGSCSDLSRPEHLWEQVLATHPQVWIWMGDNIYADTEDMTQMRAKYEETRAHPLYAQLRASARVLGTWDDHDYGANDAGREYPTTGRCTDPAARLPR